MCQSFLLIKYNWQENVANLSSPVFLRLAEMYMIRAEANAKLGNNQAAIDDVNLIRQRAGLSGSQLYTVADFERTRLCVRCSIRRAQT
jgi:hypothetical protein